MLITKNNLNSSLVQKKKQIIQHGAASYNCLQNHTSIKYQEVVILRSKIKKI